MRLDVIKKRKVFILAGGNLWCECAVGEKIVEPLPHLSSCLDLVHGDDDRILPLLLHHTGKKTVRKKHVYFYISRTREDCFIQLKCTETLAHEVSLWGCIEKTWWICSLLTSHVISLCSIVLIKCPFILCKPMCVSTERFCHAKIMQMNSNICGLFCNKIAWCLLWPWYNSMVLFFIAPLF